MMLAAEAVEAVREAVRATGPRVLAVGGGSKPALSTPSSEDVAVLDVSALRGIVEYDPGELTFTAMAATPVAEMAAALAEHGQYLPFDPPLARAGATLAGAVAAGTSGPGAFRSGSVRDFVIGVHFVDGTGELVSGGGKVVKNAAGFDLSKLMVGSMGRLGIMVQLSFKVFPEPPATATVRWDAGSLEQALETMATLGRGPLDLDALDLEPPGRLLIRLGGTAEALPARVARLTALLGRSAEVLSDEDDAAEWDRARELAWRGDGEAVVRVGLTTRSVPGLEELLARTGGRARYSLGANVAWIARPADAPLEPLGEGLAALGLAGAPVLGPPPPAGRTLLGSPGGGAFAERLRGALDPNSRFPEA